VKVDIAFKRASHVNSGTSVDPAELPWPETQGRVMRHPLLHLESDPRGEIVDPGAFTEEIFDRQQPNFQKANDEGQKLTTHFIPRFCLTEKKLDRVDQRVIEEVGEGETRSRRVHDYRTCRWNAHRW